MNFSGEDSKGNRPEQVADARSAGPAADVFSLGAILWECLAGGPVFAGETLMEVLARIGDGRHDPLDRADVPRWLEDAIERALAKVTPEQVRDAARKLFTDIHWGFVGQEPLEEKLLERN